MRGIALRLLHTADLCVDDNGEGDESSVDDFPAQESQVKQKTPAGIDISAHSSYD